MIICEIGHNHLGDKNYAEEYVRELIRAKPDAVTFQYREPARYVGEDANLKLTDEYFQDVIQKFQKKSIAFGMAIADEEKIAFFESIGTDFYKVLSKDGNNTNLLRKLSETGKKIFISTGMSNLEEIARMVEFMAEAKDKLTLIHTQLSYSLDDVNLKAIPEMKFRFHLPVAFGNHSLNLSVLFMALAFEPSDIFFYIKGEKATRHPDEEHAISLKNCGQLILALRTLPAALGQGEKLKMSNRIKG